MAERLLVGLAFTALGALLIVNRGHFAREQAEFGRRWFRRKLGASDARINRFVFLLVGAGFIVFGVVYLIGG